MARPLPVAGAGALLAAGGICVVILILFPLLAALLPYVGQLTHLPREALASFPGQPGLIQSIAYTLILATVTPLLACYTALAFSARSPRSLTLWLSPLLAIPHLAFAVGMLFLFSPGGWLVRALHSLTGAFPSPPEGALLAERSLPTLMAILMLKEIPFLLLMIQSSLAQLPVQQYLRVGQSLGYSRLASWWQLVVPQLLGRLTLPMAAVVIYTLSVVDIPLLAGPNLPGVLAQQVFQWQRDFSDRAAASAVAGGLLLVILALVLLWLNHQHQRGYRAALARFWRSGASTAGWLRGAGRLASRAAQCWLPLMALLSLGVLATLATWSVASGWYYPDPLPPSFSLAIWRNEWPYLGPLLWNTLSLALVSASVGLVAALICLEAQQRRGRDWPQWLLLLGLLAPQLPLVMGWQFGLSQWRLSPHWGWVMCAHCVFTFPYAYLVLAGDYRRYDRRWLVAGQSLGYAPLMCWFRLLLPMLIRPVLYAWVIAFAVSVAQYLPTQLLGAGRVVTVTTEAVNIGSGGDRRLLGLYALCQFALPLAALLSAELYLVLSGKRDNAAP